MDHFEPYLVTKKEVRFTESLVPASPNPDENFGDIFGGIIKSGQWGWLTNGSRLCITSLRTGQLISNYDFDATNGFGVCIITCVSEIQMPFIKDTLIAIGIQYADSPGGLVVLYSVEESTVICCIDLKYKITCCKFISYDVAQNTIVQNMNGCLAIGTDGGRVLLVDLNLRDDELPSPREEPGITIVPCHIVDYSLSLLHIHRHFQHCQQEGVHFGIQLEVLENANFIQSLLPIELILGLAVGLTDGRLVLYDLTDMQVFYVAPPQERLSPLVKISCMEPPDDPRPCVYIWAFHEHYQNSMAVMHSLMYEKRVVADNGFCFFENFQVSSVRLQLPLNCPKSVPIACQAISKPHSHGNEETISLCALVWKQEQELQTEVLLFDINQWYKEEMPYIGDWREDPSYLASFVVPGLCCLDMYFNSSTISLFNSIQRPEEHFYPISLSFDSIGLGEKSCFHLNWPGVQNRVINALRSQGSLALLDPNPIFIEVLNARLLPQFSGLNYKATFSLKAKRETLLSVAIENNCHGLLRECAKNWSDGSHQGISLNEGLSLSTLTDWLWTRASSIKERCNKLCKVLFDHSGYTLDQREKQELSYISKQLRTLADLSSDIISKFGANIPPDVLSTLESQGTSIRMASDYQEILLWLLNIGLLPEASGMARHRENELNLVPYPYEALHSFYEKRRLEFMRYSSRKARSCYLLFIDSFLEHSFKGNTLRDCWQESGGDGLYPPTSIQAMLRIMLIQDVSFENKCALFLYFFLDLNMAIEEKRYEPIVQNFIKFPSVFKLSASLIKQIQAFWNLDHCHFQAAVDEFISPFNKDHICPQWQIELFITSLLEQMESNLALRVLEAKSLPISPLVQLNTYLANDLISEAFHFARAEKDQELLKLFFSRCLLMKKFGVIRDLALTENEGKLVQSLLKNSKNRSAEDLSFVYLLQKYKYIEAVAYQDELLKGRDIQRELSNGRTAPDVDNPSLILAAYHTTMTPVTKNISDVYLRIKKRIKNKETEQNSPLPLSCQFTKQNANDLLGGIYHSSALGTHFASHYWDQPNNTEGNALQQSNNAPFLRSPQISLACGEYNPRDMISYPEPYKAAQKRRLDSPANSEISNKIRENPKKRRKVFDHYDYELSSSDNLLTHFKNSTAYNHDLSSLPKASQKTSSRESSVFLETPYVQNTAPAENQTTDKFEASLPGILKVSQAAKQSIDETDRRSVRMASEEPEKKKDSEEEKCIRFVLPVDEPLEQISEQDVTLEESEEQPQRPRAAGPTTRKSLRSITSYDSLIPMSKHELQDILEKVKSEQSKRVSSFKTTCSFENYTPLSRPKQDSPQPNSKQTTSSISKIEFNESLIPTSSFISSNAISKTELQDIVDRVKSSTSNTLPLLTVTTSPFENESEVSKVSQDVDLPASETQQKSNKEISSFGLAETASYGQQTPVGSSMDKNQFESVSHSSKRALSESSDASSNSSIQRSRKQLKGRASIHSSPEDQSEYKTPTAPAVENITTTTVFEATKTIFKTDTLMDFSPRTSSSKVYSTESRFNRETTESIKVVESESQSTSPSKVTFSERTTIIGELSYLPTMPTVDNQTETPSSVTLQSSEKEKEQMLDTTVGMTLYDTMGLDEHPQDYQPVNENSVSVDLFDEEQSSSSDLLVEKTSAVDDDTDGDKSSSSIILLSSRSCSRDGGSRNQDSVERDGSNVELGRHISINDDEDDEEDDDDDDDDVDEDDMDDYDDYENNENDDDDDASVEIIHSDGSEDLSNSFSNNIREVTSTSTSSSLASVLVSEVSSNSDKLLQDRVQSSSESRQQNLGDGVPSTSDNKNSSEPEIKLSVTSESVNEIESDDMAIEVEKITVETTSREVEEITVETTSLDVKEVTVETTSREVEEVTVQTTSREVEEVTVETTSLEVEEVTVETTEQSDHNEIEVFEPKEGIEVEPEPQSESQPEPPVQNVERQTDEQTPQAKSLDMKPQNKDENMKAEDPVDRVEEAQDQPTAENLSNSAQADEENVTQPKPSNEGETRNIEKESEKPTSSSSTSEEAQQDLTLEKNEEVFEPSVPDVEEVQKVEAESTVKIDAITKDKDSTVEEQELSEEVEPAPRLRSKSISKKVPNENIAQASPRTRKNSRSGSVPPQKVSNEVAKDEDKQEDANTNIEVALNPRKRRSTSVAKNLLIEPDIAASPRTRRLSRGGSVPPVKNATEVESVDEEKPSQSNIDVELTPKRTNRRSTSVSKQLLSESEVADSPRRLSRGGSVPPSSASKIVKRRKSLLLEAVDETLTPDSPSTRTRSKIRSESIDGDDVESSTTTHMKRSRLSSISSVASVEQPQTPRTRRRSSLSMDKEVALETPKASRAKSIIAELTDTPVKTPRRRSTSKKPPSPDESSPTSSKSVKSQKKDTSESPQLEPEAETPQSEDYTMSRRLTRTQLAAMERNLAMSKQAVMSPVIKKRRGSNTTENESPPDAKISDNESTSSRMSRVSTASRRITRSLALKEGTADDLVSNASSTESSKRKRKRVKEPISPGGALKVIPEEGPSGSEGSETSKKTTRQKK